MFDSATPRPVGWAAALKARPLAERTCMHWIRWRNAKVHAMFNFPHTLFIGSDLDPLTLFVHGGEVSLADGRSMRVEDSDVEIGPFKSTTPEAVSSDDSAVWLHPQLMRRHL